MLRSALTEPKNAVLSNHKRWLHSLQMLKRQLAEEEQIMAQEEADKKKRVRAEPCSLCPTLTQPTAPRLPLTAVHPSDRRRL